MRGRALSIIGSILGLAGLALLVVETVDVLNGNALSSTGKILLYVGLGLFVVAGILLVIAVATAGPSRRDYSGPAGDVSTTTD